jgi:hypothetical protein
VSAALISQFWWVREPVKLLIDRTSIMGTMKREHANAIAAPSIASHSAGVRCAMVRARSSVAEQVETAVI